MQFCMQMQNNVWLHFLNPHFAEQNNNGFNHDETLLSQVKPYHFNPDFSVEKSLFATT